MTTSGTCTRAITAIIGYANNGNGNGGNDNRREEWGKGVASKNILSTPRTTINLAWDAYTMSTSATRRTTAGTTMAGTTMAGTTMAGTAKTRTATMGTTPKVSNKHPTC